MGRGGCGERGVPGGGCGFVFRVFVAAFSLRRRPRRRKEGVWVARWAGSPVLRGGDVRWSFVGEEEEAGIEIEMWCVASCESCEEVFHVVLTLWRNQYSSCVHWTHSFLEKHSQNADGPSSGSLLSHYHFTAHCSQQKLLFEAAWLRSHSKARKSFPRSRL